QVWLSLRRRHQAPVNVRTPWLYRQVRHPLYLSWLIIFWAAPRMTAAHLVFAVAMTAYIFVAIQFEERDLIRFYGDDYRRYREQVPMILPLRLASGKSREIAAAQNHTPTSPPALSHAFL